VRIISLVPSVTETLAAWDRTPIACTRFCERPDLIHVGGTKDPDLNRIVELHPDLVIVDAEENRREDYDDLVAHGLTIHVLHIQSLADVDSSMRELAVRVAAEWTPLALSPRRPTRATAFVPIWRRPWIALGAPTYGASVLAHLGVQLVPKTDRPYPEVTLNEMCDWRPDVVLAPSEPYPFSIRQGPELATIAPVIFLDGQDLFWWGARTSSALGRLATVLDDLQLPVE
jgi:ABC-type Fe3+-hydroxamate transport system substrate-binding protein